MTTRNDPWAYGFLAGLLVLLLAAFANACVPSVDTRDEVLQPTRTVDQRMESAVAIYTECGSGSGVLVDGLNVYTAFHVINCGDIDNGEIQPAKVIVIRTFHKLTRVVLDVAADPGRDLARLRLDESVPDVVPVRVRRAVLEEDLCAYAAVPERAARCGSVDGFETPRRFGDVSVRDANWWYGNSGSGVYGTDGTLIGIVTRLKFCSPGDSFLVGYLDMRIDTCGGMMSSLVDSPVMV